MARKRNRRPMPRLALLDSTRINELVSAIDQMRELADTMQKAVPALVELANVSRELLAITSKMHQASEQQHHEETELAAKRSEAAKKAAATRKAKKDHHSANYEKGKMEFTAPARAGEDLKSHLEGEAKAQRTAGRST